LDKALSEKIRNYFTDRIEEIKEGTFVPSWDQFKDLPEFVGTYRSDFINARDEWFKQTFNISLSKFSVEGKEKNYQKDSLSEEGSTILIPLILIIGLIVGIIISGVGAINLKGYPYNYQPLGAPLLLIGGIIILGVIIGYIYRNNLKEKKRDKKVDSMSQSDLAKMFDCPSSGNKGAVLLIRLIKDQILVKQSCPTLHPYGWTSKVRVFRIPLRFKDLCASYFRDAVFRCYKCGQKTTVDLVKFSGPWTLIKLSCPTHGNKLPTHKIWSTVYSDISNGVDATP
jgi:hypothetical protein